MKAEAKNNLRVNEGPLQFGFLLAERKGYFGMHRSKIALPDEIVRFSAIAVEWVTSDSYELRRNSDRYKVLRLEPR